MAEALARIEGVREVRAEAERPTRFVLDCVQGADPRAAVFRLAVERAWTLVELASARASLEDIFVRLTTSDRRDVDPAAVVEASGEAA
jgi:hypothetical protein